MDVFHSRQNKSPLPLKLLASVAVFCVLGLSPAFAQEGQAEPVAAVAGVSASAEPVAEAVAEPEVKEEKVVEPEKEASNNAKAGPTVDLINDDFIAYLRNYTTEDVFQIVVGVCNDNTKSVKDSDFEALDAEWKRQSKEQEQPVIARALTNPLSLRVTQIQAQNDGLFLEVFVMDQKGLNCGQSSVTSDYWQGDEAKWQKTFAVGPDAYFVDEAELNEDLGVWATQVSLTIKDKVSGAPLGSVTYEVNLTELDRRIKQGVKLF